MIGKFQVIHQHAIRICTSWNTQSTFSPRWSVKISADSGTYLQQAKASTSKGPFAATGGQCRRDKFDYSIHSSWFRMLIVITSMFFSFCWYIFFLYIYMIIWNYNLLYLQGHPKGFIPVPIQCLSWVSSMAWFVSSTLGSRCKVQPKLVIQRDVIYRLWKGIEISNSYLSNGFRQAELVVYCVICVHATPNS